MRLVEYPDREMMMIDLAHRMAGEINTALMGKGRASLAVAGGITPGPAFDALCGAVLDWGKVTVMTTDERCVPEDSPRSNARLVRQRLIQDRAAAAGFLSFAVAPEADLAPLNEAVAPHLPLDLVLLGMGGDMHTASLFPGAPELAEALAPDAPPLVRMSPGDGLEPRITLSGRVLREAVSIHILITGPEKRRALETAASAHDAMLAPVSIVLQDATIHWAD